MEQNTGNWDCEDISYANALSLNICTSATRGLEEIIKPNFGNCGTLKMLVSSLNDIKITKDGFILLKEMQIQNPVASLIAKSVCIQHYKMGDGATSIIIIIGNLFSQIEKYIERGIHPQILQQGVDVAKRKLEKWLPSQIIKLKIKRNNLILLAKSILSTKLRKKFVFKMATILSDSLLTIYREKEEIDTEIIEIILMDNQTEMESRFIKGIVLDHGSRHMKMPTILNNVFILLCNISLEYEKSEFDSEFIFNSENQQEKMFIKEREYIDKKVKKIIQLKRFVCKNEKRGFLVINQKGIDASALDLFSREKILAVRRAKRKNMERISLMCNATPVNSVEDIKPEVLGYAGLVYEQSIDEEKYTFIENVSNPFSGTILIKGKNLLLKQQAKNTIKNTLIALKNFIKDKCALIGGGKIEVSAYKCLIKYSETIRGRKKFGIIALAKGIIGIPKTLSENSGEDPYEHFAKINQVSKNSLDSGIKTKKILDCFSTKRKIYDIACTTVSSIMLIDEILLGKGLS
nr:T-complex protein 1, zeta SU [Cryptomonas paramecium]